MLKVISEDELQEIKKKNVFFNFEELEINCGYCIRIHFEDSESIVRYSDLKFGANKEQYENSRDIVIEALKQIIQLFNGELGVVAKYNEKWIIYKEKSKDLWHSLSKQKISNKFTGGFIIKESSFIEKVIDSILKYNCFALFIFDGCVIAPSDHMDVFIWFYDENFKNKIRGVIDRYKMLKLEEVVNG